MIGQIKAGLKAISGAFPALNAWMRGQEIKEARKDGVRQGSLAEREKQDEIRQDAKKVRRRPKPRLKRDAINRLRRHKGKGRN